MESSPKKSLGQHWLNDQASLKAIVDSAQLTIDDTVLEIGPGPGSLTKHLVKLAGQVIAVEYDHGLVDQLSKNVDADNLLVIEADILKFNLGQLPPGYKVVANIPYYLTSYLLRIFTEAVNKPQLMVLLLQKEVAERAAAQPGQMSLLSVSMQLNYEPKLGVVVPAQLFTPPPKVDSQVLILSYRSQTMFENLDEKKFFQIVKAGFSERRKKLRGSLSGGLRISKVEADELLSKAGIDGNLRAQNLSLADWHKLYLAV